MSLTFKKTENPVAFIKPNGGIIHIDDNDEQTRTNFKELNLKKGDDSTFSLIPCNHPEQRDCIFISGRSGSGKSTWCSDYLENFHNMFPDRDIYVFSALRQDSSLDHLPITRINLDESFLDSDLDFTDLKDSCCLFDDCSKIKEKDIASAVKILQDRILDLGRHSNINVLVTNHQTTDYNKTRNLLAECSRIVICSRGNNTSNYFLEKYSGLSKEALKKIKGLKSRWYCINMHGEPYILHEKGIFIP